MKKTLRYSTPFVFAAVVLWGCSQASAADRTASTALDHREITFMKDAAADGQAEVQMGALGAQKAQNQEIKTLAQHLQTDHTKANQELMQLAQSKGVNLPTEQPRKEERAENRLQDKTGAEFDKAFAEHAIKDHEKDIEKFQKALQSAKDPDVRAFIEKNLPALQQHLQMARTAGAAVGVDQRVLARADRFLSNQGQSGALGTSSGTESSRSTTGTGDLNTHSSGTSSGTSGTSNSGTSSGTSTTPGTQNR